MMMITNFYNYDSFKSKNHDILYTAFELEELDEFREFRRVSLSKTRCTNSEGSSARFVQYCQLDSIQNICFPHIHPKNIFPSNCLVFNYKLKSVERKGQCKHE